VPPDLPMNSVYYPLLRLLGPSRFFSRRKLGRQGVPFYLIFPLYPSSLFPQSYCPTAHGPSGPCRGCPVRLNRCFVIRPPLESLWLFNPWMVSRRLVGNTFPFAFTLSPSAWIVSGSCGPQGKSVPLRLPHSALRPFLRRSSVPVF